MRSVTTLILALALAACASPGPGADCDPCAQAEAVPVGPGAQAAAAAAAGGQRVSQDPRAEDTARISPVTTVGRGQGATSSETNLSEGRVVASGAGVTQGLQVPTDALASNRGAGAIPQAVLQIREDIEALQSNAGSLLCQAQCAYASGRPEDAKALMLEYRATLDAVRAMQQALATAECGGSTRITNYYFQQGQRVVQSVVSGTDAGSPSVPISEAGARAAAEALSSGAQAVMTAPATPAETTPAPLPAEFSEPSTAGTTSAPSGASLLGEPLPGAPAGPDSLPSLPPAGAVPAVPVGVGGPP